MSELQHIRFAGWALTKGQHRPKTGKKKKTREAGLFFLVPASSRCSIRKWVNPALPIVVLTVLTHPIKFFPRFQWGSGKNFIERSRTIKRSRSFQTPLDRRGMASLQSNSTFSFKHHLTGEAWPACRAILPFHSNTTCN